MNSDFDVIIIGAGTSGCGLARFLKSNLRILLIDQADHRDKLCGGVLTEKSVEIVSGMDPPEPIYAKPKLLNLCYRDNDNQINKTQKRGFVNIHRDQFDVWMLAELKTRLNIEIRFNSRATNVSQNDNGFSATIAGQVVFSRLIIDATGAESFTLGNRKSIMYVGYQELCTITSDQVYFDVVFDDSITDYYCWIIPKDGRVLIGSAFKDNVKTSIKKFKDKVNKMYGVTGIIHESACRILRPVAPQDIVLAADNVIIIGEAAGLICPSTGDGISYALRSAQYAAQAINNSSGVNEAVRKYRDYSQILLAEINDKMRASRLLKDRLVRSEFITKLQDKS